MTLRLSVIYKNINAPNICLPRSRQRWRRLHLAPNDEVFSNGNGEEATGDAVHTLAKGEAGEGWIVVTRCKAGRPGSSPWVPQFFHFQEGFTAKQLIQVQLISRVFPQLRLEKSLWTQLCGALICSAAIVPPLETPEVGSAETVLAIDDGFSNLGQHFPTVKNGKENQLCADLVKIPWVGEKLEGGEGLCHENPRWLQKKKTKQRTSQRKTT